MHRPHTITFRLSLLEDARAVIDEYYADDLTVEGVARRVATSRRQLQRCFNQLGGESFRDCLTRVRMERAADMLRHGRLPVRHVASAVGYRQPAQFAKAFRRLYGVTPTEYRYAAARRVPEEDRLAA